MKRTAIRRVSPKTKAKRAIYLPLGSAYVKKYFLCMVDLDEHGFDPTCAPVMRYGVPMAAGYEDSLGTRTWIAASHIKRSRDVHHKNGRTGTNLLDQGTWMAVSRRNHDRIHRNPGWARQHGYIL